MFFEQSKTNLKHVLFSWWLAWKSARLLFPEHAAALQDAPVTMYTRAESARDAFRMRLRALAPLLEGRHLERDARQHACKKCEASPTLGSDVNQGVSVPICGFTPGRVKAYPFREYVHGVWVHAAARLGI